MPPLIHTLPLLLLTGDELHHLGRCTRCRRPNPDPYYRLCPRCCAHDRRRDRGRVARRRAAGDCLRCGVPGGWRYCAGCRAWRAAYARAWRARRREADAMPCSCDQPPRMDRPTRPLDGHDDAR